MGECLGGYGVMGVYGGIEPTWAAQTNVGRTHIATKGIVQSGLVLNLDAGVSSSYSGSGTTWTDLSGNGNNGTLINGVGYNSGNGGSLVFDGVDDVVSFNNILGSPSGFSFGFILNYNSTQSVEFPRIFAGNTEMETNSNSYFFRFRWQGSVDSLNNYIVPNVISDYCITYSSPSVLFYRNGILFDTKTLSSNTTYSFNTIMNNSAVNRPLNGSLYKFSIYNRELTASEIQQNFIATRSRFSI